MSTHGAGYTKRHSRVQTGRSTHGGAYVTDLTPSDPYYGSNLNLEQITNQDIAPGAVDGGQVQPGVIDATHFDTEAPDAPTGVTLDSLVGTNPDGTPTVVLRISWIDPTASDLHAVFVEHTSTQIGDGGTPDWSSPSHNIVGAGLESLDVLGVLGSTTYWVRLRAVDVQGNLSLYTTVLSIDTTRDTVAPSVPTNPLAVAGFRGAIFKWDVSTATDLEYYEVGYTLDDGSGTAPSSTWTSIRTRATNVWISGLTPTEDAESQYWFRVQAIDRSGNESGYTSNSLGVTSAMPTQVGAADIAANSISTTMISTEGLDANVIKTGLLAIGITGQAQGIDVFLSTATTDDKKVGHWDGSGIIVYSSTDKTDYVKITDASVTVYKNGSPQSAMTPDGINASAIKFGALSGGHNLVPNSSFEVGPYSADTTVVNTIGPFVLKTNTRCTKTGSAITTDGSW